MSGQLGDDQKYWEARERDKRLLKKLKETVDGFSFEHEAATVVSRRVNKRTHRIRFEDESEDEVTIIIEKR